MGISIINLTLLAAGWLCVLFALVMFVKGAQYNEVFESLSENEFPLHEIYGIGMAMLALVKYKFKSKKDKEMRNQLSVLYGEKYSEYYLRVLHSQACVYGLLAAIASFALYGIGNEPIMLLVGAAVGFVLVDSSFSNVKKKITKRTDAIMSEFSEVLSQLALLTNAGMILKEAWAEVANSGEGEIYEEMRNSLDDMNNGVSEMEAIRRFGNKCMLPEAKKFSATVVQGMEKGNKELSAMITAQSDEMWMIKQQLAKRAGEKADSQLMAPLFIMFGGILVMIIVPVFSNLGV